MTNHNQTIDVEPKSKIEIPLNREFIGEHQGKNLYKTDNPKILIQEFISNINDTDKGNNKSSQLEILRNEISSYLFEYLEGFHIATHFIQKLSGTEMVVRQTDTIPLTVKIFNCVNGTLLKRLGLKDGVQTDIPIIEHYFQNDQRNGSWVNEYHVYALGLATPDEFKQINRIVSKVNAILRGLCDRRQLMLADLQLEFGRYKNQIILSDELSPLTCHFLDMAVESKTKRDRFTPEKEASDGAITELRDRLTSKV
ncbi:MAG: phosphoribosylaminoimidazolesuccinocarboxamide synthase [Bacteroidota bacterium]|nr:phosphoribosylaminoimidazolesuccinocarboxamide synthase [Bacteroidota bacterium]